MQYKQQQSDSRSLGSLLEGRKLIGYYPSDFCKKKFTEATT